jgi:hypothetical protein
VRGVCSECGVLVSGNPPDVDNRQRSGFFDVVDELLGGLLWWIGLRGRG